MPYAKTVIRLRWKELGFSTYQGAPCVHGHGSERYTHNGRCVLCIRAQKARQMKLWRKRNPDKDRTQKQRRRRKYYEKHPEKVKARLAAVRLREKLFGRGTRKKTVGRKRQRKLGKYKRRGAEGAFTTEDLRQIYQQQGGKCKYCPKRLVFGDPDCTVDHVVPIVKGGTNWPANIALACSACNTAKGAKMPLDFLFGD